MAFITHVGTAVPPHAVSQTAAAAAVARACSLDDPRSATVRALFERARVNRRYSAVPPDGLGEARPLTSSMALYRDHALELALAVGKSCLAESGLDPRRVDLVVSTSCTGVLMPSLGALLVKPLGLRRDVRRLPLTELGCAGGASALARAHEFVRAYPQSNVLVLAVELPSLTFQADDSFDEQPRRKRDFRRRRGRRTRAGRQRAVGSRSSRPTPRSFPIPSATWASSSARAGFTSCCRKTCPAIIARETPGIVREFLADAGISPERLAFYVLHAGGSRVIEALERELGLERSQTCVSWDVLRDHGNQSSASVLFVLRELLRRGIPEGYGLLAAFGPGITVELSLLRRHSC